MGLTCVPLAESWAATISTAKPAPTRIRPMPNLVGLDGSFLPMRSQIHAKTGASMKRNAEFIDWNQLLGKLHPKTDVRVLRSANRLSVEPACSNADQNSAAATNRTAMT